MVFGWFFEYVLKVFKVFKGIFDVFGDFLFEDGKRDAVSDARFRWLCICFNGVMPFHEEFLLELWGLEGCQNAVSAVKEIQGIDS